VWRNRRVWEMYYTGTPYTDGDEQIGYATSTDGINWEKYAGNPILGSTEDWARLWVVACSEIMIDSTYYLYYTGFSMSTRARIGLATSAPMGIDDGGSSPPLPSSFSLFQNYPNPFNPGTVIRFTLPGKAAPEGVVDPSEMTIRTSLVVYDGRGRRVRTLLDGILSPGTHYVTWDGKDFSGTPVPSGIYFYRMRVGEFTTIRKMVLLK